MTKKIKGWETTNRSLTRLKLTKTINEMENMGICTTIKINFGVIFSISNSFNHP